MDKELLIQDIFCKLIKLEIYDINFTTTAKWLRKLDFTTLGDINEDLKTKGGNY